MSNQMRAEIFKLLRNKTIWVLVFTITGISAFLHYLVIIEWWQMSGTPFDQVGLSEFNAITIFTVPTFFNLIISPLAGFYISNEFSESGAIKNQIISGSKRSHIFLAKYLIFSIGAIVVTIIIPLMTVLVEVILLGQGEILTTTNMLYLVRTYGLFILQFVVYTAILVLIAIVTEDSGKTIIFSILLTITMYIIDMANNLPIISTIYKNSIFYQFSEVFNYSMTNGEVIKAIIIALLSLIVVLVFGVLIFNKKEIK